MSLLAPLHAVHAAPPGEPGPCIVQTTLTVTHFKDTTVLVAVLKNPGPDPVTLYWPEAGARAFPWDPLEVQGLPLANPSSPACRALRERAAAENALLQEHIGHTTPPRRTEVLAPGGTLPLQRVVSPTGVCDFAPFSTPVDVRVHPDLTTADGQRPCRSEPVTLTEVRGAHRAP